MQYTEKDIEDHVEAHVEAFVDQESPEVLARQYTLPSGRRIDLLVLHDGNETFNRMTVVEIKRGRVDGEAVLQTLEYIAELRECIQEAGDHSPIFWAGITGLLIGTSITERAARIVRGVPSTLNFVGFDAKVVVERVDYLQTVNPEVTESDGVCLLESLVGRGAMDRALAINEETSRILASAFRDGHTP